MRLQRDTSNRLLVTTAAVAGGRAGLCEARRGELHDSGLRDVRLHGRSTLPELLDEVRLLSRCGLLELVRLLLAVFGLILCRIWAAFTSWGRYRRPLRRVGSRVSRPKSEEIPLKLINCVLNIAGFMCHNSGSLPLLAHHLLQRGQVRVHRLQQLRGWPTVGVEQGTEERGVRPLLRRLRGVCAQQKYAAIGVTIFKLKIARPAAGGNHKYRASLAARGPGACVCVWGGFIKKSLW